MSGNGNINFNPRSTPLATPLPGVLNTYDPVVVGSINKVLDTTVNGISVRLPTYGSFGPQNTLDGFVSNFSNRLIQEFTDGGVTPFPFPFDSANNIWAIQILTAGNIEYNQANIAFPLQPQFNVFPASPMTAIFKWLKSALLIITGDLALAAYTSPFTGGYAFQQITGGDPGGRIGFDKAYSWGALGLAPCAAGVTRTLLINACERVPTV